MQEWNLTSNMNTEIYLVAYLSLIILQILYANRLDLA